MWLGCRSVVKCTITPTLTLAPNASPFPSRPSPSPFTLMPTSLMVTLSLIRAPSQNVVRILQEQKKPRVGAGALLTNRSISKLSLDEVQALPLEAASHSRFIR